MAKTLRSQISSTTVSKVLQNDLIVWDDKLPGFGRRSRNGKQSWIVQKRVAGKSLRRTLGPCKHISQTEARELAEAILRALDGAPNPPAAPCHLDQFAERFLEDCKGQWKPATLKAHRENIHNQILPGLGDLQIDAVIHDDVTRWINSLTCSPGTSNRCLAVLSSMLRHAEIVGLRPAGSNPCAGRRRHMSDFKADYLDARGYAALGKALDRHSDQFPIAVAFVRFLALTGCRKGEAEAVRWDQLDGDRIALPDAKNGPKAIWLGTPARELLAALPRTGSAIFAGDDLKAFRAKLGQLWRRVRKTMRRPKFRLHDLRHSFASIGVNQGLELSVIGGLLGHANVGTTAGYTHLDVKRLAEASERVGRHLQSAISVARAAGPKPLNRRRPLPDRSIFQKFASSKLTLDAFCKVKGLNTEVFRKDLLAWRESNKRRISR